MERLKVYTKPEFEVYEIKTKGDLLLSSTCPEEDGSGGGGCDYE